MTENYSIESIQEKLESLRLPFCNLFARALVALLTARKISIHEITHLMPGEQNAEANRQQIRRRLDHESLTQEHWTRAGESCLKQLCADRCSTTRQTVGVGDGSHRVATRWDGC